MGTLKVLFFKKLPVLLLSLHQPISMSIVRQVIKLSRILLLGVVLCPQFVQAQAIGAGDDGVRIDVPASAKVRIENQFGQVSAEVWKEKYVSVSASIEGSDSRFTRSPIVIENKAKLLSISIIRTPIDP